MVLTESFLLSLNVEVGNDVIIYDVKGRKIYFLHRHDKGFRLRQVRGKRQLPIRIRKSDRLYRVNSNGTVEQNNYEGFIVM